MRAYLILRRLALSLRSVQTALLGASYLVSDYAQQTGERAKKEAAASIDRQVEAGYAYVDKLDFYAEAAADRADKARSDWERNHADIARRSLMIEWEVL